MFPNSTAFVRITIVPEYFFIFENSECTFSFNMTFNVNDTVGNGEKLDNTWVRRNEVNRLIMNIYQKYVRMGGPLRMWPPEGTATGSKIQVFWRDKPG